MLTKLFSEAETGIIRNLILTRSYKQIADLLGCATEDINLKADELQKENSVVTYQMKLDEKAAKRVKRPKTRQHLNEREIEKKREQLDNITTRVTRHKNTAIKEHFGRRREPEIKTKVIDYSKTRSLKVDDKTTLIVGLGESDEDAINKFRRNQEQSNFFKSKHGN